LLDNKDTIRSPDKECKRNNLVAIFKNGGRCIYVTVYPR